MIVTEEEAKTKWCPLSRALMQLTDPNTKVLLEATSANRIAEIPTSSPYTSCIGSRCMAWEFLGDIANRGCCSAFAGSRRAS